MTESTLDQQAVMIVSGLPRSGTSMMMQILEAGGVPVLSDHVRRPDSDNPKGYYELEAVKKVRDDASWIAGARGKAVKMVYLLLYDLPDDYRYRVVFMDRKLEEVIASQNVMLARSGQTGAGNDDELTARLFGKQLREIRAWLERKENFEVLYVSHGELLRDPGPQLERIREFAGPGLDVDAMAGVIDSSLYRNRR